MAPLSAHLTSTKLQKEFYTFDISLMDIEYLVFSNGVTEAWPIMFFWGECMPDLFHSSKAPRDLCLTQDLDEIVNTQGGHDLQKSPQGLSSPPLLFREARMISGQTFSGQVHYGRGVQHDPVSMISTNIKAVILFPSEQ